MGEGRVRKRRTRGAADRRALGRTHEGSTEPEWREWRLGKAGVVAARLRGERMDACERPVSVKLGSQVMSGKKGSSKGGVVGSRKKPAHRLSSAARFGSSSAQWNASRAACGYAASALQVRTLQVRRKHAASPLRCTPANPVSVRLGLPFSSVFLSFLPAV
jgi:hypothetical protein